MNKKNSSLTIGILLVVALIAIAIFITNNNGFTTNKIEQTNFIIEDTSSITRIHLTDTRGGSIDLTKVTSNYWMLNDTYRARTDAVQLLLKTMRRIQVKQPVPSSSFEQVVSQIASNHVKAEIYSEDNNLDKTWYIGGPTQNHYGTYMLLETPGFGKSSVPHIMHFPGFYGFLTARFFMDENDWRWSGVFNYHPSDITSIKLENLHHPSQSFEILYNGENNISLLNTSGVKVSTFDTLSVKNYMLNFKKKHFETFDKTLNDTEHDSLQKTEPAYRISVTNKENEINTITIWDKKALEGATNAVGETLIIDPERKIALYNGDWLIVQNFAFNSLYVSAYQFTGVR